MKFIKPNYFIKMIQPWFYLLYKYIRFKFNLSIASKLIKVKVAESRKKQIRIILYMNI